MWRYMRPSSTSEISAHGCQSRNRKSSESWQRGDQNALQLVFSSASRTQTTPLSGCRGGTAESLAPESCTPPQWGRGQSTLGRTQRPSAICGRYSLGVPAVAHLAAMPFARTEPRQVYFPAWVIIWTHSYAKICPVCCRIVLCQTNRETFRNHPKLSAVRHVQSQACLPPSFDFRLQI